MNSEPIRNRWNDTEASSFVGDLGLRVYTSRLLGRDPSLVLHGGGNTSVKLREKNVFGEEEDILYVKGSGWDLETIEPAGFSPCRQDRLLRLAQLPSLSDKIMADELRQCMTTAAAPAPSVEAILHALLPHKFVDHTHADALISISNTPNGEQRLREIYGNSVVYVPYVMPGFKLARLCAELFPKHTHDGTRGMVLVNHGLFSFGPTARASYEAMIELVKLAEAYLQREKAWTTAPARIQPPDRTLRHDIAALRRDVSLAAGTPMILSAQVDSAFARHPDLAVLSQQGPATPDHVIRTKRVPLIGRNVAAYADNYRQYFAQHAHNTLTMLDPAPRVILDPDLGLCSIGRTAKDAQIAADIYGHTADIIQRAAALDRWEALPARDIFDVEYWDLEQAKLRKNAVQPPFTGEVAVVTGAASGIGKGCVEALLHRGAAVVGLDVNPLVGTLHRRPDYRGIVCDLTDERTVRAALELVARAYGGLDMVVLNAGIFPEAAPIAGMKSDHWRRVMAINLDANLVLLRESHPLLKLAPNRGRVVVIGSKNVPAPGPGAAAYSASKAAMNQLARVAALEWGADGIRINTVHPNMVFDTGLWTPELLEARAKHYNITVEEYKTNNVLKVSVTSRDVAELAVEMCSPLFGKTTAAQIPVDGGNDRVI